MPLDIGVRATAQVINQLILAVLVRPPRAPLPGSLQEAITAHIGTAQRVEWSAQAGAREQLTIRASGGWVRFQAHAPGIWVLAEIVNRPALPGTDRPGRL